MTRKCCNGIIKLDGMNVVNYFEITFVRDEKVASEMFRWYYYRRKKMRFLHIACSVLMAWAIAWMILFQQYEMGIFYVFALTMLELFLYRCYRVAVRTCLKRDLENNMGQLVTLTTIIHDDIIRTQVTAENGHDVLLNQMKWAIRTKTMVIIGSKARVLYVLPNDGFVHGTPEELIQYLREKGIPN